MEASNLISSFNTLVAKSRSLYLTDRSRVSLVHCPLRLPCLSGLRWNIFMVIASSLTESDILEKIVDPSRADLTPDAARSLLALKFDRKTTSAIRKLLRKNNQGAITAEERLALEKYLRVGQFL